MTDSIVPTRAQRPGDSQPLPTVNDAPDIQSAVIADIAARRQVGIGRYGTALQPGNGRNALLDAYEETLDLACYLKQRLVEDEVRRSQDEIAKQDEVRRSQDAIAQQDEVMPRVGFDGFKPLYSYGDKMAEHTHLPDSTRWCWRKTPTPRPTAWTAASAAPPGPGGRMTRASGCLPASGYRSPPIPATGWSRPGQPTRADSGPMQDWKPRFDPWVKQMEDSLSARTDTAGRALSPREYPKPWWRRLGNWFAECLGWQEYYPDDK